MSLIVDKSDTIFMYYDDFKFLDIAIIHETFINDENKQYGCQCGFKCDPKKDIEFTDSHVRKHHVSTSELFGNLCKCDYFGSTLFCFDKGNAAHYLAHNYLDDFMTPNPNQPVKDRYCSLYVRPYPLWIKLVNMIPQKTLNSFKQLFVSHQLNDYE